MEIIVHKFEHSDGKISYLISKEMFDLITKMLERHKQTTVECTKDTAKMIEVMREAEKFANANPVTKV
jgi:hypothetical protein